MKTPACPACPMHGDACTGHYFVRALKGVQLYHTHVEHAAKLTTSGTRMLMTLCSFADRRKRYMAYEDVMAFGLEKPAALDPLADCKHEKKETYQKFTHEGRVVVRRCVKCERVFERTTIKEEDNDEELVVVAIKAADPDAIE